MEIRDPREGDDRSQIRSGDPDLDRVTRSLGPPWTQSESESPSSPTHPPRRESLLEAIAGEEARLDRLEAEQAAARTQLAALRSELASLGSDPESADLPLHPSPMAPRTPS